MLKGCARKTILESRRKMKIYETGRKKMKKHSHWFLLGMITHGLQSASQHRKTNSAQCRFIYIITLVFVACLLSLQAFLISTSQSEINRYRLPEFILGLGKNNDSLFTPTQVLYASTHNFHKTTSDVYALVIRAAEKSVTTSTTDTWVYFRFRGGPNKQTFICVL